MRLVRTLCGRVMTAALIGHIVLTICDNIPDDKLQLQTRLPSLKIPQWRFFAPNPGIEDLYVMYRYQKELGKPEWSNWKNISFQTKATLLSTFWNPGNRAQKALFDTAQQIRTLGSYGATFDWVVRSQGYRLLSDVVRDRCRNEGVRGRCQFMILASVPQEGKQGLNPIMVSPEMDLSDKQDRNYV